MEIQFEIVPADIRHYSKEAAVFTPLYTANFLISMSISVLFMISDMLLAMVSVVKNDGSIKVESFHLLPRLIIDLTIVGLIYVVLTAVSKNNLRKLTTGSPGKNGLFCEHTITLEEDGFTERTEVNRSFHSWEGVEKVADTKNFVAIHIRLGSGYIIPKRAFPDVDEMKLFISTARSHIEKAAVPTPPPLSL